MRFKYVQAQLLWQRSVALCWHAASTARPPAYGSAPRQQEAHCWSSDACSQFHGVSPSGSLIRHLARPIAGRQADDQGAVVASQVVTVPLGAHLTGCRPASVSLGTPSASAAAPQVASRSAAHCSMPSCNWRKLRCMPPAGLSTTFGCSKLELRSSGTLAHACQPAHCRRHL